MPPFYHQQKRFVNKIEVYFWDGLHKKEYERCFFPRLYRVGGAVPRALPRRFSARPAQRSRKSLSKRIFRSDDKDALFAATSNLTANLLGLPGAPTPLGIRATQKFCEAKNDYAADMLFVLNATSLQLLPVTVIALRSSLGSAAPHDIILPTLIATLLSTLLGALLVRLTAHKLSLKRRKKA